MIFMQMERPTNPRRCWAAHWCNVWLLLTGRWVESKHDHCGNYARTGHLTCYQHRWYEAKAWREMDRLNKEEMQSNGV